MCQNQVSYGRSLERKICNPLAYVADRLKKLRGFKQPYIFNVNIVLMLCTFYQEIFIIGD